VEIAPLASFYGGPIWKAHSAVANTTMIDIDNVLLQRPLARPRGPALREMTASAPSGYDWPHRQIQPYWLPRGGR
jgi:hypothetical protein